MTIKEAIMFWGYLILSTIFFSTATILQALDQPTTLTAALGWLNVTAAGYVYITTNRIKTDNDTIGEQ